MAAFPVAARAADRRVWRIGMLVAPAVNDPVVNRYLDAMRGALQELGLTTGENVEIHTRGGTADPHQASTNARELIDLKPDLVVAASTPGVAAVLRETRAIPVVFINVADPVGSGFVPELARPGGNITGFTNFETTMAGKWVELLKEIVPSVRHLLAIYDPQTTPNVAYVQTAQEATRVADLQLSTASVRNDVEVEAAVSSFSQQPNRGLIVFPDAYTVSDRRTIIALASKYGVPAVYGFSVFAKDGGLASYGPDPIDPFRRAASYVDRILKGSKPDDLPIQQPAKFELIVNLKTAKALGITVPPMLLARADEVIE